MIIQLGKSNGSRLVEPALVRYHAKPEKKILQGFISYTMCTACKSVSQREANRFTTILYGENFPDQCVVQ